MGGGGRAGYVHLCKNEQVCVPKRNFGRQKVITVPPSRFVSNAYLLYSLRQEFQIWSISLILFEVGTSNLVCGCILGCQSNAYHNWVTVTLSLTSDLISTNCIESGAYLLYSLR